MTTSRTFDEVSSAITGEDSRAALQPDLARQLLTVTSILSMDALQKVIAGAGFLAVPQRRQSDRVERADVLQIAESTVVGAAMALYVGIALGFVVALLRVDLGIASMALIGIGLALCLSFAVGGIILVRGTRRLYRRIEGERYLRATRRSRDRMREDGTSGYAWVGRQAS